MPLLYIAFFWGEINRERVAEKEIERERQRDLERQNTIGCDTQIEI